MSFDWREFIQLSKSLLKNNEEASFRSAISRAYYAAFNLSEIFTNMWISGIYAGPKKDPSIHDIVIYKLSNASDSCMGRAGRKLSRLWGKRIISDYKRDIPINEPDAKTSITWAEEIINVIDNWRP